MSEQGGSLTERLLSMADLHRESFDIQDSNDPGEPNFGCTCTVARIPGGYRAHLADVTARVVEAWLGEQRGAVEVALRPTTGASRRAAADAALTALVAGTGVEA